MEGMVVTQWHDSPKDVDTPFGSLPVPFVIYDKVFGASFKYENRWMDAAALVAFCCLTIFGAWTGMRFKRSVQR